MCISQSNLVSASRDDCPFPVRLADVSVAGPPDWDEVGPQAGAGGGQQSPARPGAVGSAGVEEIVEEPAYRAQNSANQLKDEAISSHVAGQQREGSLFFWCGLQVLINAHHRKGHTGHGIEKAKWRKKKTL